MRGEEAYVLFQAVSTGHGGLCTLHADDSASAIQRLISKPMDVPEAFIPFINLAITVRRLTIPVKGGGSRVVRRIISIDEVNGVGDYYPVFTYDPSKDRLQANSFKKSKRLAKLAKDLGTTLPQLEAELGRRSVVLDWMRQKNLRNFREITPMLHSYIEDPAAVYERAKKETASPASLEAPQAEAKA